MATLVCFGFGYCAEHFIAEFGGKFERVIGTVRRAERAGILNAYQAGAVRAVVFDGMRATAELESAIAAADYALVSSPAGCQRRSGARRVRRRSRCARWSALCCLSLDGGRLWRPRRRLGRRANAASPELGAQPLACSCRAGLATIRRAAWRPRRGIASRRHLRSRTECVRCARARQSAPHRQAGQVFNRIHVGDIAQAIDVAFARGADGVFNLADDEPSPPADPIVFAAQLMGREPPPEIPFAQAAPSMSEMGLSFWQECRRVRNDEAQARTWRYPALSDLSRWAARFVCRDQCRLGPLRNLLRSPDLMRTCIVSPSR